MLSMLLALQTCLPSPAGTVTGPAGRLLDEFAARMTALGAFSGVVLVAAHDTILLHRGYGRSDDATCAPVRPDTRFDIASIAKQFTGAAILALESEGRLSTSDTLGRWLPGVPPDKAGITIKQLATHRSGLARDHPDFFARMRPGSRDSTVREILALPLESPPGSAYAYSNLDYQLLAAIVERAAGIPFQRYVRERLWARAGLEQTAFMSDARGWPDPLVAHPYWDQYDAGSPRLRATSWYGLGGSQVVSSAGDLYRWLRAGLSARVLAEPVFAKWTVPDSGAGYAYGWNAVRRPDGSIGIIFHAGGDTGAGSELRYYPRRGLTVIVLTNRQHQDQLMQVDLINSMVDLALARNGDLLPAGGTAPSRRALPSGRYAMGDGNALVVWRARDGHTWLAPEGQAGFDLLSPGDSSAARRTEAARTRTREAIDSLGRIGCGDRLPAAEYPQAVPETLTLAWCTLRHRLGDVVAVTPLGVRLPGWSSTRAFVYARVRFSRGSRVMTWLWEGDRLVEMWQAGTVEYPQSFSVTEESPGVLLLYDWFRGSSRRVLFHRNPGGEVELSAVSNGSLVVARRGAGSGSALTDRAAPRQTRMP